MRRQKLLTHANSSIACSFSFSLNLAITYPKSKVLCRMVFFLCLKIQFFSREGIGFSLVLRILLAPCFRSCDNLSLAENCFLRAFSLKKTEEILTVEFTRLGRCFLDWATAVAGEADRELTCVTFTCHSSGPI